MYSTYIYIMFIFVIFSFSVLAKRSVSSQDYLYSDLVPRTLMRSNEIDMSKMSNYIPEYLHLDHKSEADVKEEQNKPTTQDIINKNISDKFRFYDLHIMKDVPVNLEDLEKHFISLVLNKKINIKGNNIIYIDDNKQYIIRNGMFYLSGNRPSFEADTLNKIYEKCQGIDTSTRNSINLKDRFRVYLLNDNKKIITFSPSIKNVRKQIKYFALDHMFINGQLRDRVLIEKKNKSIIMHYLDADKEKKNDTVIPIDSEVFSKIMSSEIDGLLDLLNSDSVYLREHHDTNVPNILCNATNNEAVDISEEELGGKRSAQTTIDFLNKKFPLLHVYPSEKSHIIYLPKIIEKQEYNNILPEIMRNDAEKNKSYLAYQAGDMLISFSEAIDLGEQTVSERIKEQKEEKKGFFSSLGNGFKRVWGKIKGWFSSKPVAPEISKNQYQDIIIDHKPQFDKAIDLYRLRQGVKMYFYNRTEPGVIYEIIGGDLTKIKKRHINAEKNKIELIYSHK